MSVPYNPTYECRNCESGVLVSSGTQAACLAAANTIALVEIHHQFCVIVAGAETRQGGALLDDNALNALQSAVRQQPVLQ